VPEASSIDYLEERSADDLKVAVSGIRRIVVSSLYCVAVFLVATLALVPFLSADCMLNDQCTARDDRAAEITTLATVLGCGCAIVLGWRGKLPGARQRSSKPESADAST
jgi:hypothetical protein